MEAEVTAGAAAGHMVVVNSMAEEAAAGRTQAAAVSVAVEALALVQAAVDRILTAADARQFQVMAALTVARADILRVRAAQAVTAVLVPARPTG